MLVFRLSYPGNSGCRFMRHDIAGWSFTISQKQNLLGCGLVVSSAGRFDGLCGCSAVLFFRASDCWLELADFTAEPITVVFLATGYLVRCSSSKDFSSYDLFDMVGVFYDFFSLYTSGFLCAGCIFGMYFVNKIFRIYPLL